MPDRTANSLFSELDPLHVSSVRIFLVRNAVVGANMSEIQHLLDERDKNPIWAATHGPREIAISHAEYMSLAAAGATEEFQPQRMVIPKVKLVAVPCAGCDRLLAVGTTRLQTGTCVCGQEIRVIFEEGDAGRLPRGPRCSCCGTDFAPKEAPSRTSPWTIPSGNPHLFECNVCNQQAHDAPCWRTRPENTTLLGMPT